MIFLLIYCLFEFGLFGITFSLAPHEITILIISQNEQNNLKNAYQLRTNILSQANELFNESTGPNIYFTHEFSDVPGSWAITPLLQSNADKLIQQTNKTTNTKWLIICDAQSEVILTNLIDNLSKENSSIKQYLGYPLRDKEGTIIHHFAFFENPSWFTYPMLNAGVALTIPLVIHLSDRLKNQTSFKEFTIDAAHELAIFIWNNGLGCQLRSMPYFCHNLNQQNCAIYSRNRQQLVNQNINESSSKLTLNNIFFAVKTYSKFHEERLPYIQKTWAEHVPHIRYYSDVHDKNIPTINTNIENTDTGHCQKTLSIFQLIQRELELTDNIPATRLNTNTNLDNKSIEWIILADDDTLINISELLLLLKTFQSTELIYLGERYGYRLHFNDGFNYITGGGGIIFSRPVIKLLVENCLCPTISSPDDMILAICLQRFNIQAIHSLKFHQARPMDYPIDMIDKMNPISFHKFWQIDPIEIYKKWLKSDGLTDNNGGELEYKKEEKGQEMREELVNKDQLIDNKKINKCDRQIKTNHNNNNNVECDLPIVDTIKIQNLIKNKEL